MKLKRITALSVVACVAFSLSFFIACASYKITFVADGEVVERVAFSSVKDAVTLPAVPQKNGYTGEWEEFDLKEEDITVNAVYTPINYRITYLLNGGINSENNPDGYNIETKTALMAAEKEGFAFKGWFNEEGKRVERIEKGSYGDITLIAEYDEGAVFTFSLGASLSDKTDCYDLKYNFSSSYFKESAEIFNKGLALLSFGAAAANTGETNIAAFYSAAGFSGGRAYGYDEVPAENTLAFYIAHANVAGCDLIALSVRGFNYGGEWAGNVYLGSGGNHAGFSSAAEAAYLKLDEYITENYSRQSVKLWITGYSRGGGVANLVADKIMRENSVKKEDLYVYTFEAPQGIFSENSAEYKNVHNIVNSADIITHFLPTEYGVKRCGTDEDIYTEDADKIIKAFDETIELSGFTPTKDYAFEGEFAEYFVKRLTKAGGGVSLLTREDYVNNLESYLRYILSCAFYNDNVASAVIYRLSALGAIEILDLLKDSSGGNLYTFLSKELDAFSVVYDGEKLLSACSQLIKAINSKPEAVVLFLEGGNRVIQMHYPEITYALLLNY